jgi:hypothetical protein
MASHLIVKYRQSPLYDPPLQQHRSDLLDCIVGIDSLSMAHPSEAQILANAREDFGNHPCRRPVLAPGQEFKPLGPLA